MKTHFWIDASIVILYVSVLLEHSKHFQSFSYFWWFVAKHLYLSYYHLVLSNKADVYLLTDLQFQQSNILNGTFNSSLNAQIEGSMVLLKLNKNHIQCSKDEMKNVFLGK